MKHLSNPLKNKDKLALISLIIVVSLLTSLLVAFNFIVRDVKQTQNELIECVKRDRAQQFDVFYDEFLAEGLQSATETSKEIQTNILNKYGDNMSYLMNQLRDDNYNNLSELLSKSIKGKYLNINSDSNTLFVANYNGIICDYSYTDAIDTDYSYRHWDEIIEDNCNKELAQNSVQSLINKSYESIIWQNEESMYDLSRYNSIDKYTLRKIYQKEGIKALESFVLLVPSYITDTGDIFGQEDIKNGIRYNNYKLIVIQRVSLYDQVIDKYPGLADEFTLNEINYKSNNIICDIYILGLLITIGFVAAMVQFSALINKFVICPAIQKKEEGEGKTRLLNYK